MNSRTLLGIGIVMWATACTTPLVYAQPQPPALAGARFELVSIKQNTTGSANSTRTLPDGSQVMTNIRLSQIIGPASPVPVSEVDGLPDWAMTKRYDIVTRPGFRPTPEERSQMLRNMLIERFKVAGHVEEVARTTFALVVVRADGQLGPLLTKSVLDCSPGSPATALPPTSAEVKNHCGLRVGPGIVESGGVRMDYLARSLGNLAGGVVYNRTGLDGFYALTVHFPPQPQGLPPNPNALVDDARPFFTALQEQLGLRLVPEKTMVKIFVIDHIERPTPN